MDAKGFFTGIKLVPVVTLERHEDAVDLALCLRDAGIRAIEVTLRTESALKAIELIADAVPDVHVGAGSVRVAEQISMIRERGAQFAVSPGHSQSLINQVRAAGMPFVPGAATATEMLALRESGYSLMKFFPAELLGGTKMLKALSAPLPEIRFFPTGGISADLVQDYLKLGCVSCVGGSWFIPVELLEAKRFNDIKTLTQSALQLSHV